MGVKSPKINKYGEKDTASSERVDLAQLTD